MRIAIVGMFFAFCCAGQAQLHHGWVRVAAEGHTKVVGTISGKPLSVVIYTRSCLINRKSLEEDACETRNRSGSQVLRRGENDIYEIAFSNVSTNHDAAGNSTNCTRSTSPCSEVYAMRISVSGEDLFVPRSVFADLGDITNAEIVNEKPTTATLILMGGEGEEGYQVHIVLNQKKVLKRAVYTVAGVKGGALEVTHYYTIEFN